MVNNQKQILDEGKLKYCSEVKMGKLWYETDSLFYVFYESDTKTRNKTIVDDELNETTIEIENENYVEPSRKFLAWKEKCFEDGIFLNRKIPIQEFRYSENPTKEAALKFWKRKEILDYLKIIPFTPSVMINISPDWGEKPQRASLLKELINSYMSEGWYDKWQYVIECGSEGTHIHAHIVAHVNPDRIKSCIDGFTYKYIKGKKVKKNTSHIGHGRHVQQLKKWANKIKGMEGSIKGNSVQTCILRTEQLVKDKLDYLIEDKKPVGHKNHHIVPNGFVSGEL